MTSTAPDPSTVGVIYSWTNNPMIVALLFGFAGAVFVGIYILRRTRGKK